MLASLYRTLLIILIKIQLARLQKAHFSQFGAELPIIIVSGSVGKSSTTLLIAQLLEQNKINVITSTTQTKNYNTLSGLAMLLSGQFFSMDAVGRFRGWAKVLWHIIRVVFSPILLTKKSALVFEMGVDHQGEGIQFARIFSHIDILVVTTATLEHAFGYSDTFDTKLYNKLKEFLPRSLYLDLENDHFSTILRNSVLENLRLAPITKTMIVPPHLDSIDNQIIAVTDQKSTFFTAKPQREIDGNLTVDGKPLFGGGEYLLPLTFARNHLILTQIATRFDLATINLAYLTLPVSRFGKLSGINHTTVIDSTYNSDPASLCGFLDMLEEMISIAPFHVLVLGEMRELGPSASVAHYDILDRLQKILIKHSSIDKIVLIGAEWSQNSLQSHLIFGHTKVTLSLNSRAVAKDLKTILSPYSWVWCKGSQNTIFCEEVVTALLQNPGDSTKVCRQSDTWKKQKDEFFSRI